MNRVTLRWPIQPLLDLCHLPSRDFELHYGCKIRGRETISDLCADRYATAAGFHPVQVWGWAWVEAGLDQEDAA